MIFNKTGRLLRTKFYYSGELLENVKTFKYLGFLLTPSGEINSGLKDLRERAIKAFYKLKSSMGEFFRSNIGITMHLFDTLVKPILLYMSDFWGGLKCPEERYNPIEKLHYMACKQFLGVQKRSTNIGVLLELGRMPLQNFAIKSAIKNWERIRTGNINRILGESHSDAIAENLPWITHVKSMLHTYNLGNLNSHHNRKHPFIHKLLHDQQCENFHKNAFDSIKNPENKLRTYSLFKTDIGCEKYLYEVKNVEARQALTKFRLSNHTLNIERGRYTTPKTPKEQRFCNFCPDQVEDELHFLLTCPVYRIPRLEMMNAMTHVRTSFRTDSRREQFIELMKNENAHLVSKTIQNLFEIRKFLLSSPKRPN